MFRYWVFNIGPKVLCSEEYKIDKNVTGGPSTYVTYVVFPRPERYDHKHTVLGVIKG